MDYERKETACFTGHRASKLPWGYDEGDARCLALKAKIADSVNMLYANGVRHFICGMALGCDMYFAEAVLSLRENLPDIVLEAAIPCLDQADHWREAQRARYARLLESCDIKTALSHRYAPGCMELRNRYMVDRSGAIIAAFDPEIGGGTAKTIWYAIRSGLNVINIRIQKLAASDAAERAE